MAVYMVRSHVPPENRDEVYRKQAAITDADLAGIKRLGDWGCLLGDGAFHLMEADDPKQIADVLMNFTDLVTYTIDPVIELDDFMALTNKHGIT